MEINKLGLQQSHIWLQITFGGEGKNEKQNYIFEKKFLISILGVPYLT